MSPPDSTTPQPSEWSYDSRTDVLHWPGASSRPTVSSKTIDLDIGGGLVLHFDESNGQHAGLTITGVRKHLDATLTEERVGPTDLDGLAYELGRALAATIRKDVDASGAIRLILRIFDAPRSIRAADAYAAD